MSILNAISLVIIIIFYASLIYLITWNHKCSGTRIHCKKEYYNMNRAQKDPRGEKVNDR